ncbi:hypothetical protein ACFY1B_24765 [Streptomyces mirabilis]|uniref:hypothetical protein n=1 Tax=Streptomyces mirabilis TaxID=68239 RepID=UPI0036AE561C
MPRDGMFAVPCSGVFPVSCAGAVPAPDFAVRRQPFEGRWSQRRRTSTTTSGGRTTARATQCVWDTSRSGDTIGWGTNYTWTSKADKANSVKSYASTVLGWHWGWKTDRAATELRAPSAPGTAV